MTVEQLILELSKLPKDLEVAFPSYEQEKHYPITEVELIDFEMEPDLKPPYVSIGQGYFL